MHKTLYLMRHGSTGAAGKFIGSTDLPVSTKGLRQIKKTAQLLRTLPVQSIFCSPLQRCVQTAEQLQLDGQITIESALKEIDFGCWEGKTFEEIEIDNPVLVQQWSSWSENFTFPGGENIGHFLKRIRSLKQTIDDCPAENILIITHGGVIRHLICSYLGIDPANYLLFDVRAGFFSTLSLYSQGGILTSLNSG